MNDAVVRGRAMLKSEATFTEVMLFEAKLWLHKQEFQKRGNPLPDDGERIRFFLSELKSTWARIVHTQQAVGLEITQFNPHKDFLTVYALSWNLEKLIATGQHSFLDILEGWQDYISNLSALGFDLNPFDFGERCARCLKLVDKLNGGFIEAQLIPLEDRHLARLGGMAPSPRKLRMKRP